MFCDLVGSTALAGALDPEDMREVLRAYQEACVEVVDRFEGHIAQYLGDGLLVYFGYPRAQEDDAKRAVRAALGIVDGMERLNTRLGRDRGARLAVRVGIHTGLVVVGEIGSGTRHEHLALGETPNLAARLQTIAEPDTVVISTGTYRLIERWFDCRDLGLHTAKGVSTPLQVYRVLNERDAPSGLEAISPGLTALVGRDQEVGLLLDRWEQVKEGLGQVVLLSGEAGIGKSRLLRELRERVAREPHTRWECRCSPYHQESALYPVIDLFQRAPEFARDEPPEDKLRKIEDSLGRYGLTDPEAVSLWAALLSVPLPADHPPLNLTPQRQKQKTLEAVLGLLIALAAEQPVLVLIEDLHWVDPSTLELLNLLLEQAPTVRVLVLLTFRPDFRPPWAPRAHVTYLTLNRLTRRQTELMVGRAAGRKGLPVEVVQEVVAKTDGIPLFVEELIKMVLESGLLRKQDDRYELSGPLPPLAIPSTLQDSLMARLDRLATVKDVAQLGATLGRSFSYELLRAVSSIDEPALQQAMGRLVEAELLYQRGVLPGATFIFKHALIQEAAYQSLLKSRRHQFHQRIAEVLAERFPEIVETQPEVLAHHYAEAGLTAKAVNYWRRAGQRAIERSASVEAISHLGKALEALKSLPDDAARLQQELELLTMQGPVLMATRGFGSSEVESVYARALEVCQQVGETPRLFSVLRGLWEFYELRGELARARELGEQLLRLASPDPARLVIAHDVLGDTLLWLGEFVAAREHLERGITIDDPQLRGDLALLHGGYDPGIACRNFAAHVLWYLGYADQGLQLVEQAVSLARKRLHPFSLVFALDFQAWLHQYRGEPERTRELTNEAMGIATDQGMAFFLSHGEILLGWTMLAQQRVDEGIEQIRKGVTLYQLTGAELERPYWLALLAQAYGRAGRSEEGLSVLTEALATVERTGARFCEAELHRVEGELRLALSPDDHAGVEWCFHQAIELARRASAKSLELRATTSLAQLLRRHGKREEARRLLASAYGWFIEGFDTADLHKAKMLLDELAVG